MMPQYDATRDGNPFYWLLAAAQTIREQRAEARIEELVNIRVAHQSRYRSLQFLYRQTI